MSVEMLTDEGEHVAYFDSMSGSSREVGLSATVDISLLLRKAGND